MKKRTRQRMTRAALYALFLAVLAFVAWAADWGRFATFFLDPTLARELFPGVLTTGARNTILYTATAFAMGLVVGLMLALMKLSTVPPYRWLANIYIEIFRGVPALLTIFLFAFGIPIAFQWRPPGGTAGAGVIALAVVSAAYIAETIRAGIEAVPRGQMEAARSLGMSHSWAMASIIIPQAFRIIVPPLTNELVILIKDTSLLFIAGTTPATEELTKFGRDASIQNANPTPFVVVGIVYLIITVPLTRLVAVMERRNRAAR